MLYVALPTLEPPAVNATFVMVRPGTAATEADKVVAAPVAFTPEGEQLFHVSRIWLVEGPRWLLRGTLMGRAGMVEGEAEPAEVFVEFFRNVVVKRDDAPRVPGELIHLALPQGADAQG